MKKQVSFLIRILNFLTIPFLILLCHNATAQHNYKANVMYGVTSPALIRPIISNSTMPATGLRQVYFLSRVHADLFSAAVHNDKVTYLKPLPGVAQQEFLMKESMSVNSFVILAGSLKTYSIYVSATSPDGKAYYYWDENATLYCFKMADGTLSIFLPNKETTLVNEDNGVCQNEPTPI